MTARRWGAGMIVACVPVLRSAIPGNDYLGIILPIPDPAVRVPVKVPVPPTHAPHRGRAIVLRCGDRCARAGRPRPRSGVAASPRDRTPRPRAPLPPRVGPTGAGRAVPVGRGGRPGNAATGVGRSVSRFISSSRSVAS